MHTITYVSAAIKPFTEQELLELLHKSRDNNARFGITGMLLYKSGSFMQAIEGPKESITQLYSNICADKTHRDIFTLVDEAIEERSFSQWHMGFAHLGNKDLLDVPGFYDIFKWSVNMDMLPIKEGVAKTLLLSFRQAVR